jgi:hypothetical protein
MDPWRSPSGHMSDYSEMLKRLEEATKVISDDSLRKIAFERLLNHELSGGEKHSVPKPHKDLPEEPVVRTRRVRSKPSAAGPAPSVRNVVDALDISPDEASLPAWGTLSQLDKYLWILEAAHLKSVDGLSPAEISKLIYDVFKENHQTNQVNNIKTRIKRGHVRAVKVLSGSTNTTGYQILKGGIDHLRTLASGSVSE